MFTNIMTTFQQIFLGILILVIFFGVGIDNINKSRQMKEKLRHKLSAFLHSKKASEENPFNCHILLDSAIMGTPIITEIFEDNEGIIWLKIDNELIEFDDIYTNSDLLLIEEALLK